MRFLVEMNLSPMGVNFWQPQVAKPFTGATLASAMLQTARSWR